MSERIRLKYFWCMRVGQNESGRIVVKREEAKKGSMVLKAYYDGEPAGTFAFFRHSIFDRRSYMSDLYVEKGLRGKGIGKALIAAALAEHLPYFSTLHKNGISHLAAFSAEDGIVPHLERQFESAGYKKCKAFFGLAYWEKNYPNPQNRKTGTIGRLFRRK